MAREIALGALGAVAVAHGQEMPMPAATEMTMDRLVVTATGWETTVAETAPAMTVITAEELERKQVPTVAEALREVPGVVVTESGSRGGQVSVSLRGADADQVLVLIDGVEVNGTTAGQFDFSDLTPENVERIEIVRGWGGTLHGSEAVGGVIQIFTRRGEGPPRGSVSVSGGNGYTDREVAEASGRSGIFAWSGSASHFRTEGFKPENDDYENTVVSARVDARVVDDGEAGASVRIGRSEFGNFFSNNFLGAPDPNARQEDERIVARVGWRHDPSDDVGYRIGAGYSRDDLSFRDPADAVETSSLDADFLGEVVGADGRSSVSWWDGRARSTLGIEFESRSGDVDSLFADPAFGASRTRFDETVDTLSGFGLQQLFFDERRLVVTGGIRADDNSRFGIETSPSAGVSYAIRGSDTRLRATYAEGFKAPSLNELFFPGFGNPDLDAETSREVSVGFDQPCADGRLLLSSSWFRREVENLIQGVPQENGLLLAENVGDATILGVETAIDLAFTDALRGGGQHTFLDLDADPSGRVRRPKHAGSVYLAASRDGIREAGDRVTVDVRLLLIGEREDFDPAQFFAIRENPAYQRVDLAAAYAVPTALRWARRARVFARIENLLDRDYEESLGFGARPINFLAGIGVEL